MIDRMSDKKDKSNGSSNITKSICIPKTLYAKAMHKATSLDRNFSWFVREALKKDIRANEKNLT